MVFEASTFLMRLWGGLRCTTASHNTLHFVALLNRADLSGRFHAKTELFPLPRRIRIPFANPYHHYVDRAEDRSIFDRMLTSPTCDRWQGSRPTGSQLRELLRPATVTSKARRLLAAVTSRHRATAEDLVANLALGLPN